MAEEVNGADPKPYPGPRPFDGSFQKFFFGRGEETSRLASLVIANELVLLYAQSGAGKSSLINAGLVPALAKAGLETLPIIRVRSQQSDGGRGRKQARNIFIYNTLLCLENSRDSPELAGKGLAGYLAERAGKGKAVGPRVLIFDQFEEIFTNHQDHWERREEFFEELAEALSADRSLRILLSLREDFLAALDPFADAFTDGMGTRMRLERLGEKAALEAVSGPLTLTRRRFAPGAAEKLVTQLLSSQVVDEKGEIKTIKGPYVEPVQLAVVCESLWARLPADREEITSQDLVEFGDVKSALKAYYEAGFSKALSRYPQKEAELRALFSQKLITAEGTRGVVFQSGKQTCDVPNGAIQLLEDHHLIRAEIRGGGSRWYELTHDRFIEPIQESNRPWFEELERRKRAEDEARRNLEERQSTAFRRRGFQVVFLLAVVSLLCGILWQVWIWFGEASVKTALFSSKFLAFAAVRAHTEGESPGLGPLLAIQALYAGEQGGNRYSEPVLEALRLHAPAPDLDLERFRSHTAHASYWEDSDRRFQSSDAGYSWLGGRLRFGTRRASRLNAPQVHFREEALTAVLPFDDSLLLLRWRAGQPLLWTAHRRLPRSPVALDPGGDGAAFIDERGRLRSVDTLGRVGDGLRDTVPASGADQLSYQPGTKRLHLVAQDGSIRIWEAPGSTLAEASVGTPIGRFLVFDREGKQAVAWADTNPQARSPERLVIFACSSGMAAKQNYIGMRAPYLPPAFSHDGRLLAVASDSLFLIRSDTLARSRETWTRLPYRGSQVTAIAFAPFVENRPGTALPGGWVDAPAGNKDGSPEAGCQPYTKIAVADAKSVRVFDICESDAGSIRVVGAAVLPNRTNGEFQGLAFSGRGDVLAVANRSEIRLHFLRKDDLAALVQSVTDRPLSPSECREYMEENGCRPEPAEITLARRMMLSGKPDSALSLLLPKASRRRGRSPWLLEASVHVSDSLIRTAAADSAERGVVLDASIWSMPGVDSAAKKSLIETLQRKAAEVIYEKALRTLSTSAFDESMSLFADAYRHDPGAASQKLADVLTMNLAQSRDATVEAYRLYARLSGTSFRKLISAETENNICWDAAKLGIVEAAPVCDSAVHRISPVYLANTLDSRGLMRVRQATRLSPDSLAAARHPEMQRALSDFREFVKLSVHDPHSRQLVKSRQRWISRIQKGLYPLYPADEHDL